MIITIATILKVSTDIDSVCTKAERANVNKVKLKINPVTIPTGLLFPPTVPERMIGSTGRMQGDSIVTIPDINAKKASIIIIISPILH